MQCVQGIQNNKTTRNINPNLALTKQCTVLCIPYVCSEVLAITRTCMRIFTAYEKSRYSSNLKYHGQLVTTGLGNGDESLQTSCQMKLNLITFHCLTTCKV
jgi:hypothetical protein